MPIYEYACTKCQDEFELLVGMSETPSCPNCGSDELEKQLSVPAAHSRGGELPIAAPMRGGTCGLPQCGQGGCQGE